MNRTHPITYYLQVQAKFSSWDPDRIWDLKPRRITRRRPSRALPDCAVVKVTMNVPDMLFAPVVELAAGVVQ